MANFNINNEIPSIIAMIENNNIEGMRQIAPHFRNMLYDNIEEIAYFTAQYGTTDMYVLVRELVLEHTGDSSIMSEQALYMNNIPVMQLELAEYKDIIHTNNQYLYQIVINMIYENENKNVEKAIEYGNLISNTNFKLEPIFDTHTMRIVMMSGNVSGMEFLYHNYNIPIMYEDLKYAADEDSSEPVISHLIEHNAIPFNHLRQLIDDCDNDDIVELFTDAIIEIDPNFQPDDDDGDNNDDDNDTQMTDE
jgi:hypothetical protein